MADNGLPAVENIFMPSPPYSLSFEDRNEYLFARVNAYVVGLPFAVTYISETIRQARESGATKLLFVRETPVETEAHECSMIGSVFMNVIPKDLRAALVDRSPTTEILVQKINTETKKKGRDIQAFSDVEEARAWLLAAAD